MKDLNKTLLLWSCLTLLYSCKLGKQSEIDRTTFEEPIVKESLLNGIQGQDTLLKSYYFNDTLFLSEKLIKDQVVRLQVFGKNEYDKYYLSRRSIRSLGSDLFIYNCMNCHSGFPFVKEELSIGGYKTSIQLSSVLNSVKHRNQGEVYLPELSKEEVSAIFEYVKGPKKEPID